MKTMQAAGVIFDCDGVLVDTEAVGNRVLAELLTEAALPTTTEESMRTYLGRSWASGIAIATEKLGRPLPSDLRARYERAVREAWQTELQPIPGLVPALDAIDLPTCVASSGDHDRMRFTLGHTGLYERFAGRIFSATDVEHGKPAPDLFLHAAARMVFDPARVTPSPAPAGRPCARPRRRGRRRGCRRSRRAVPRRRSAAARAARRCRRGRRRGR